MVEYVEWHITNKCNLQCLHCMKNSTFNESDNDKDIVAILKFLLQLHPKYINITGGEPLLYRKIFEVAKLLVENNSILTLSTNGTIYPDYQLLKQINVNFRGGIQISLDSPSEFIHDYLRGRRGAYEKTIYFIKELRKNYPDYNIQICMCLNKYNCKEILFYKDILEKYSINSFKVLSLYQLGRANENDLAISENDSIKALEDCRLLNKSVRTNVYYNNPELNFEIINKRNMINEIKMLNIDESGNIKITPYLRYIIGNVREINTIDIFYEREKKVLKEIHKDINGL